MTSLQGFIALCALIGYACAQATYGTGAATDTAYEVFCTDTDLAVFFSKTNLDSRQDGINNNRTWQIYFEGERDNTACTTYHWDTAKQNSNYVGAGDNSITNPSANLPSSVHIGTGVNNCGINVFSDATHIIYNTTLIVTYGQNPTADIGREEYDKYNVKCLRNRTVNELQNFNVQFRQIGNDAKNVTEDFGFTFTHTNMANQPTLAYKLGEYIKFTVTSDTARTEVKAVIQRCWTTTDGSANSYTLVQNRCDFESGSSWVISPTQSESIFKTEAFRYLAESQNKIYAQCLVRVCLDSQTTPECTLCINAANAKRRRRSTEEEESTVGQMAIVKSPVFYIIDRQTPAQGSQESSNFMSGTNGLIVIILLATLVFVIAAAIVKKVFFSAPAAVATPVVAYSNKAMA